MNKRNLLSTCFLLCSFYIYGQELKVINSLKEYRKTVKKDANNKMVDVQKLLPKAVMDMLHQIILPVKFYICKPSKFI